jgi:Fur family iron response transcriptional regulator
MHTHELTIEDIKAMLREHDVTPTSQRLEIAMIMLTKPQHLSADQVLQEVNRTGDKRVSKATVYNTLGLFADKGLLRQVIVDPSKVFYDSNTGEHHHFYNVDTGQLSDIEQQRLQVGSLPELPKDTVMDGVEVIVRVRQSD